MSKTYDLKAIIDLPISVLTGFLLHAIEQEQEKMAWELWKSLYPQMSMGIIKFVKFEEFKKKLLNPVNKTQKTKAEIINEMTAIAEANRR